MNYIIKPVMLSWLVLSCMLTYGQSFQKSYTGDLITTFNDIVPTPDGGFLAVGVNNPPTLDSSGALLFKLNSDLDVEWVRKYKFLARDGFSAISKLADGNYLLAGTTRQTFTLTCGGSLIKVDGSGNVIWSRYYDESCDDRIIHAFEKADNSLQLFIRLGVTGRATKILHTTSTGEIINKIFYKYGDEEVKIDEVTRDAAGNFYLAGMITDDTVSNQFFVIKHDGNSAIWANFYETGRSAQSLVGIALLPNGNLGLTGQVFVESSTSNFNSFLIEIGTDGSFVEAIELDNFPFEFSSTITGLSDGSYILGGTLSTPSKATMTKFSAAGDLLWSRSYGNDADFVLGGKILEMPDGRLLQLARRGSAHVIMADELGRTPCDAYTLSQVINNFPITVSSMALSIETPPVVDLPLPLTESTSSLLSALVCLDTVVISSLDGPFEADFGLFPNPAREFLVLKGLPAGMVFSIVSVSGEKVLSGVSTGSFTTVSVADLPKGIYVVPELASTFVVLR